MHICTLTEPISDGRWKLDAGSYVLEDISAHELSIAAKRGTARTSWYDASRPMPEAKSTLLISNCGFGDAIMWLPALRKFRQTFLDHRLVLSTRARIHQVFQHLDFAPELIDYPVPVSGLEGFDRILCSEHIQEDSEEGRTVPAIDIKARILGVGPLVGRERKPYYCVTTDERLVAHGLYPKTSTPRIGVQLQASSPVRTYHPKRMTEVLDALFTKKGYEVFLFGSPGSIPESAFPEKVNRDPRFKNLTQANLTFRESVAALETCDAFFGMDSSMLHAAGTLGIPSVGLFASIHWKLRTADYPSVLAIYSNMGCGDAPCGWHPKGAAVWKPGAICESQGHCVPLNSIDPEMILAKIEKQLSR